MKFQELDLIEPILKALDDEGYVTPTPIQEQAIPHALLEKDLLGCAQTGTGKTAAFAIPILQNLHKRQDRSKPRKAIKSLILTPTRELAIQIADSFRAYGRHLKLRGLVIFGGVSQKPQVQSLKRGVDILVATPGRLLDLMNQGFISLADIEIFVLDEADRMLDMGFIHDVRRVIKALPEQRQTLFFSATMPKEIAKLSQDILTDPVRVAVTPVSSTAENVEQSVYYVEKRKKRHLLSHLMKDPGIISALVFTRTKHGANRVAKELEKRGTKAMAIHGNKSQTARQKALKFFKDGKVRVLVATDIAARGIDVEELSHVINFDLPNIPETYVHRIGRTGRAGASGIALSFCDMEEVPYLKDIQKLIKQQIPIVEEHPYELDINNPPPPTEEPPQRHGRPSRKFNAPKKRRPHDRPRPASDSRQANEERRNNKPSSRRPQKPNSPRRQDPKKKEPELEASDKEDEDDRKWSPSIFKKTSTGKKGFVILSDRSTSSKKRPTNRKPPHRGGKR